MLELEMRRRQGARNFISPTPITVIDVTDIAEEAVGIGSLFNSPQRIFRLAAHEAALAVSRSRLAIKPSRDETTPGEKIKMNDKSLPPRGETRQLNRGNPRQFPRDARAQRKANGARRSF